MLDLCFSPYSVTRNFNQRYRAATQVKMFVLEIDKSILRPGQ